MKSWCMNKMRTSTKRQDKKRTKKNSRAEEYNNWIEKFTRGDQWQIWSSRRKKKKKNQWTLRVSLWNSWVRMKKSKKKTKRRKVKKVKGTYGIEYHQADQHMHWGIPAREERMKQAKWKTNSQMLPKSEEENGHLILRGSKDSN